MATPDHLFNLRNNFYLGAYQAAINSSDVSNLSEDDALERDTLVHRCYIALGQLQFVISEIQDDAPTPLQAVKLLALYFSSPDTKACFLRFLLNFSSPLSISSPLPSKSRRTPPSPASRNGSRIPPLETTPRSGSSPVWSSSTRMISTKHLNTPMPEGPWNCIILLSFFIFLFHFNYFVSLL